MTRILFLSANPKDTPPARLDEEIRTIEERIRLTELRHLFDVKHECALKSRDLQRTLLQHKPEIVHFAGEGDSSGKIMLEDEAGRSRPVSVEAVSQLFSILKGDEIQCVLMSACYSEIQARAIARHVPYVVGWSGPVCRNAAINFAAAFYQALGFGRSLRTAFELAHNQLTIEGIVKNARPVLFHQSALGSDRRDSHTFRKTSAQANTGRKARSANHERRRHLDAADFVSTGRFVQVKPESSAVEKRNASLLSRLNDGGANDRSETARQLGYLRDPSAIPILESRWPLEDDPTVRYWLAVALGWIGGVRATNVLTRLKQSEPSSFTRAGIDEALNYAATLT